MWKYLFIGLIFITIIHYSISLHVRICNQGIYLARCYLRSQTITYGPVIHTQDTDLFPIYQCATLVIPLDSVWNYLECKALTFIAIYSTIFTQEIPITLLNSCYTVQGTILNPTWAESRCF